MRWSAVLSVPLLLAGGCIAWESSTEDGLAVRSGAGHTSPGGLVEVPIPVEAGQTSLILTASFDPDVRGYAARVRNPAGEVVYEAQDWWEGPRNKTNGGFASSEVSLVWPVDVTDDPLTPGTWSVTLGCDTAGAAVDVVVALKEDSTALDGPVRIRGKIAREVADDPVLGPATLQAFDDVRDTIYANLGVQVSLETETWEGPSTISTPGYGSRDEWLDATADKAYREVLVVVVLSFEGLADVFGAAGGIPGSLVPTDRSAVGIGALLAAGVDGTFSASEQTLYAETIAHEVGHYFGLFHPAELPESGPTVTRWDVVPDTPECDGIGVCEERLGGNLMYPTPVCANEVDFPCDEYLPQQELTPAQREQLHRHPALR